LLCISLPVVKMANSCGHCSRYCFHNKIKEQNDKLVGFGEFSQKSTIPIAALAGLADNLALATYAEIGITKKDGIFARPHVWHLFDT
jgi:hypothetical protein